jgi:glc operon protein GlcG
MKGDSMLQQFHSSRSIIPMTRQALTAPFALALTFAAAVASAQAPPSPPPPPTTPYGAPIGLAQAKKVTAAAEAEAVRNGWSMVIVIMDSADHVVMQEKLDNTQYGALAGAEDKARSALHFKRSTKDLEEVLARGGIGLRYLALRGAMPLEGGVPIVADGKIVGSIGVGGGTSVQDGQVAKVGSESLKQDSSTTR